MLLLRVLQTLHWSAGPMTLQMKSVPINSIVRFWKTFPPDNLTEGICDYHKYDTVKCRHICVKEVHSNLEYRTNVCMEEARLFFVIAEKEEDERQRRDIKSQFLKWA